MPVTVIEAAPAWWCASNRREGRLRRRAARAGRGEAAAAGDQAAAGALQEGRRDADARSSRSSRSPADEAWTAGDQVKCSIFQEKDSSTSSAPARARVFRASSSATDSAAAAPATARCSIAPRGRSAARRTRRASIPGMKGTGHMGGKRVTTKNLLVDQGRRREQPALPARRRAGRATTATWR